MPVSFWSGLPQPRTTHEALARNAVIEDFAAKFGAAAMPVYVVFDFSCGADLDIAIFTEQAIAVVELKECAQPIDGAENGEWRILNETSQTAELRGGRYGNPFQQVKQYRYVLMDFLDRNKSGFLSSQKASLAEFDHLSAVLVFSPTFNPQSRIHLPRVPWFHIVGLDRLADLARALTSPKFSFMPHELERLVSEVLHCTPVYSSPTAAANPIASPVSPPTASEPLTASASPLKVTDPLAFPSVAPRSAEDQFELAMRYFKGDQVPQNDAMAWDLFEASALGGNPQAMAMFGQMSELGRNCDPSDEAAVVWYLAGVRRGDPECQIHLANFYFQGRGGLPEDLGQAMDIIHEAAIQGHSGAQGALGIFLILGQHGLQQNLTTGKFWLEKASAQNDVNALRALASMYEKGHGVEKDNLIALDLYRKGAALNDPVAINKLASFHPTSRSD